MSEFRPTNKKDSWIWKLMGYLTMAVWSRKRYSKFFLRESFYMRRALLEYLRDGFENDSSPLVRYPQPMPFQYGLYLGRYVLHILTDERGIVQEFGLFMMGINKVITSHAAVTFEGKEDAGLIMYMLTRAIKSGRAIDTATHWLREQEGLS